VLEHGDWLMAQLAHNGNAAPALQPHATASIPLRGGDLPVTWHEGRALRLAMSEDGLHGDRAGQPARRLAAPGVARFL
jgi:hypothetical protein